MPQFRGPNFELDLDKFPIDPSKPLPVVERKAQVGRQSAVEETCLLQLNNVRGEFTIYLEGAITLMKGDPPPLPFRIEWKLFRGIGCMSDDEPIVGVTLVRNELKQGVSNRQGVIFQVGSLTGETWWLCGRIIDNIGSVINVPLRIARQPVRIGPRVTVGTAIG